MLSVGQKVIKVAPWDEIRLVNDFILHLMALVVAGERSLWLNLSGLSEAQKVNIMDTSYDHGSFLTSPGEDKEDQYPQKKGGKAFDLCLPKRHITCPPQTQRSGFTAAAGRDSGGSNH